MQKPNQPTETTSVNAPRCDSLARPDRQTSMNPIAILGSARKGSNTGFILRRLIAGRACDIVDLRACSISPFDYESRYPEGDQFISIIRLVVGAPITMVATPVYG